VEGEPLMSDRRSITIPGLSHLTAIPVATRVGPLVVSSVIAPFDPGTRDVPDTIEEQIANIFRHVGAMLDEAGATWDDVAKMSFWVAEPAHRAAIEAPWLEHFPDGASRPSRHTHITKGAPMASADFLAYVTG
jgi:2-iminobutanoate/2-iminopropanoate deaminase